MTDSLETHAVSYAHELEAMVRQKNAEIERLRALVLSGERDLDRASTDLERLRVALQEINVYLSDHSLSAAQIVDRLRVRARRSKQP